MWKTKNHWEFSWCHAAFCQEATWKQLPVSPNPWNSSLGQNNDLLQFSWDAHRTKRASETHPRTRIRSWLYRFMEHKDTGGRESAHPGTQLKRNPLTGKCLTTTSPGLYCGLDSSGEGFQPVMLCCQDLTVSRNGGSWKEMERQLLKIILA